MEITHAWRKEKLGDVVTFQRGFDLPKNKRCPGNVPIVSSAGITDFHDTSMASAPGVVTGRYGTIGELFFLTEEFWPLNTTLFVKNFHGNEQRFIFYLLQRFDFKSFSGKSGVPGVNRNDLHAEEITLPTSTQEQRAIATALSDVDALLAAQDKLIAKKHGIKRATMQQLLTGERRLPGFSGDWKSKRLGEVGIFLKGSGVRKDEAMSGGLPCIRYGEIYTHHNNYVQSINSWISPEVAATATRIKQGDLLFAGSGETKEEIGKCVAFVDSFEAYAGGDIVILRPTDMNPIFMGYCCNTATINKQKASLGQGDAVVHISAAALSSIEITLPHLSEQTAIATVLSDMDAEIAALEKQRNKTRSLKQGMMQELLTGRIRLV